MEKSRVLDEAGAVQWRQDFRGVVVFTNGVFDLLHAGHVHLLDAARRMGDALVVGINDDQSASLLDKGPGRPVCTVAERVAVVSALRAVDRIVVFAEATPSRIIELIRPHILVKGSDYAGTLLPGQPWIEANGGRVELVPVLPSHSSSNIVERIQRGKS